MRHVCLHADYADSADISITKGICYAKNQRSLPTGEKQIEQNLNQIKQIIILQNLNKICRISRRRRPVKSIISVISVIWLCLPPSRLGITQANLVLRSLLCRFCVRFKKPFCGKGFQRGWLKVSWRDEGVTETWRFSLLLGHNLLPSQYDSSVERIPMAAPAATSSQ